MIFKLKNINEDLLENKYPKIFEEFNVKRINKKSDYKVYNIEINSIEELLKLKELINEKLILCSGSDFWFLNCKNKDFVIEIYDDWREQV